MFDRVTAVLGYQPQELLGKSVYDFYHPDDREQMRDSFAQGSLGSVLGTHSDIATLHCTDETHTHTHTHTHTEPFYGSLDFVRDNPGEPVQEETFTHSHLDGHQSCLICFLQITIHGMVPVQFMCLTVFFHNLSPSFLLAWHPPLHTPYISSPNHCL